ncbi:hypothetical protein B9Z65_4298 [Elsinoe australis]|uniref:Zinc finger PHD-type domain-containing protein n=1 Tax=Elsinoe australis TaxID=40998 RepID=A0A2P7Z2E9_9PEZI|nr:hypothetical protein B9Z65_4298 [Elsinoe australis]
MPSPPRRSTRSVNPPSAKTGNSSSSSSSVSSSRPERNTRASKASPIPNEEEMANNQEEVSENEEDGGDEKTRCICGQQDYPGPPSTDENRTLSEESGSLFIQCDRCKVWQHGGCVGIMNDDQAPDEYFCELCEKKDHQLHTDLKGQRYSIYLPVVPAPVIPHPSSRKTSVNRSHDSTLKRDRDALSRLAAEDLHGPKRRSTMNSRNTFEEEEMLRKAIEESKGDHDTGSRRGKRLRDESEDVKPDIKRQRTGSESIDAGSTLHTGSLDADSDDEVPTTKSALKRARAAAAETVRQREMRDREKAREQAREEAAGRRQARAGRRRNDEQDSDDLPKPAPSKDSPSASRHASPPEIEVTIPSSVHKKSGKKGKRLGRNQYTKDRETSPPRPSKGPHSAAASAHNSSSSGGEEKDKLDAAHSASGGSGKHSPASLSAENTNGQPNGSSVSISGPGSTTDKASHHKGRGKHARGKHAKATDEHKAERERNKNPIPELERQTAYMLDFIARYQAERSTRPVEGMPPFAQAFPPAFPAGGALMQRSASRFSELAGQGLFRRGTPTSHPTAAISPSGLSHANTSPTEEERERDKERLGKDEQGNPVFRGVENLLPKGEFEKLDREGKVVEMVRGLAEWRRIYAREEKEKEGHGHGHGQGLLGVQGKEGVGLGVAVEGP